MHRIRHISTRAKYALALCGVLFLTSVVPPAFGATSVATQVAQALKLAKKADKNAKTALKLAKAAGTTGSSASGSAGADGKAGPPGPAGADGKTGATGPAGPAGPAGPQGAKGDAGAAGAPGAAGPAGPKGDKGDSGSSVVFTGSVIADPIGQQETNKVVLKPAIGHYVATAHVALQAVAGYDVSTCRLMIGGSIIDTGISPNFSSGWQNFTLIGAGSIASATPGATGVDDAVTVRCFAENGSNHQATVRIIAQPVGTIS